MARKARPTKARKSQKNVDTGAKRPMKTRKIAKARKTKAQLADKLKYPVTISGLGFPMVWPALPGDVHKGKGRKAKRVQKDTKRYRGAKKRK